MPVAGAEHDLGHGDVVIAAITSCTNTSNPSVMVGAGLLARNAIARGLSVKPWVKTSLAPGSKVVSDYLARAGLQDDLDALGFNLVGYGCTTCIGNSGPLAPPLADAVESGDLVVCSVLSGNRNFEGRISPHVKANYLASPPLVVAYAIAGSMTHDLGAEPIGTGSDGEPVYLKEIWPTAAEIGDTVQSAITPEMFRERYGDVFTGDDDWRSIAAPAGQTYAWDTGSTYVQHPPYFQDMAAEPQPPEDIRDARILCLLGDTITTDHISPAGAIGANTPGGAYLLERQIGRPDFNSYGARRGNHDVMMRGTFANIRIRNELAPGTEGGVTRHMPEGTEMPVYDAAMAYQAEGVPLVVIAGKEYGTGSSRGLGGQGHAPAGCARRHRRELRAHPPLEPGGDGRAAAGVHRGRNAEESRPRRQRTDRPGRRRRRHHTAHDRDLPHSSRRRLHLGSPAPVPDRHRRRGRLLPPRWHPALRAPGPRQGGVSPRLPPIRPRGRLSNRLPDRPACRARARGACAFAPCRSRSWGTRPPETRGAEP